uniref:Uncharacterized protein n=1 Tax=Trichuris muris TaxID=70415 RepID=A0A5S6QG40_TRIMR
MKEDSSTIPLFGDEGPALETDEGPSLSLSQRSDKLIGLPLRAGIIVLICILVICISTIGILCYYLCIEIEKKRMKQAEERGAVLETTPTPEGENQALAKSSVGAASDKGPSGQSPKPVDHRLEKIRQQSSFAERMPLEQRIKLGIRKK